MNPTEYRKSQAARLRELRSALGLDQEKMGSLLGISREWISKLENEREDFSEFVLMKIAAAEARGPAAKSGATSHVVHDKGVPYGDASMLATEARRDFEELLRSAKNDPERLGWIRVQMREHLAIPKNWRSHDEINQRAHELAAQLRRESRSRVEHPPGKQQSA